MEPEKPRPLHSYMSRKRLNDILADLEQHGYDDGTRDAVRHAICRSMNFDPDDTRYKEYQKQVVEKMARERNTTAYVVSGRKAYYERKKKLKGT